MLQLPVLSGKRVIKILYDLGFVLAHKPSSNHVALRRGRFVCVIPSNHDEIASGTLNSILRQAGVSRDEFLRAAERRR